MAKVREPVTESSAELGRLAKSSPGKLVESTWQRDKPFGDGRMLVSIVLPK